MTIIQYLQVPPALSSSVMLFMLSEGVARIKMLPALPDLRSLQDAALNFGARLAQFFMIRAVRALICSSRVTLVAGTPCSVSIFLLKY